ncbi:class I SAM-dependent methyltransferase [bacterium]|nr:class I SAM-dependent methyltransferase [bacterium]
MSKLLYFNEQNVIRIFKRNIGNLFFIFTGYFYKLKYKFFNFKKSDFIFSNSWAESHFENWKNIFNSLGIKGLPKLRYLEIGSFEGKSLLWMLENVLSHSSSRAVSVDVFGLEYSFNFQKNIARSGFGYKVKAKKGFSHHVLRKLPLNSFDIIYIDGSHSMADVFIDLALSWNLLKVNGIMILDDYGLGQNDLPVDLRPQKTIDTFISAFGKEIQIIHFDHQVIFKKTQELVHGNIIFDFGKVRYNWYKKCLIKNDKEVYLTSDQARLFDDFIKTIHYSYKQDFTKLPVQVEEFIDKI